jgi:hypothetical protein
MTKRIAAALLWFFVGWYTWAFIAIVGDLTPLFGPVLGAALASVFAADPMHRIWTPRVSNERIKSRLESIHVNAHA